MLSDITGRSYHFVYHRLYCRVILVFHQPYCHYNLHVLLLFLLSWFKNFSEFNSVFSCLTNTWNKLKSSDLVLNSIILI